MQALPPCWTGSIFTFFWCHGLWYPAVYLGAKTNPSACVLVRGMGARPRAPGYAHPRRWFTRGWRGRQPSQLRASSRAGVCVRDVGLLAALYKRDCRVARGLAPRNDNLRCFFTGSQMLVHLRLAGTPALPFAHVLARRSMRHRCWFSCGWRGRQPSHLRGLSGMRLAKIPHRLTSRRPL
jgi:hypothetical protein